MPQLRPPVRSTMRFCTIASRSSRTKSAPEFGDPRKARPIASLLGDVVFALGGLVLGLALAHAGLGRKRFLTATSRQHRGNAPRRRDGRAFDRRAVCACAKRQRAASILERRLQALLWGRNPEETPEHESPLEAGRMNAESATRQKALRERLRGQRQRAPGSPSKIR